MTITVQLVNTNHVYQVWDLVEPFLKSAEEKSGAAEYTLDHIKMYLTSGQWQLLAVVEGEKDIIGAMAVNFINYPIDRVAFITAIGGKSIATKEAYDSLCQVLKACGATKIQGAARESVARLWKRLGFEERAILVEAKL